jgi:hypothetical protein
MLIATKRKFKVKSIEQLFYREAFCNCDWVYSLNIKGCFKCIRRLDGEFVGHDATFESDGLTYSKVFEVTHPSGKKVLAKYLNILEEII